MRGRWELTKIELDMWQYIALQDTKEIQSGEREIADLTLLDITPYQVHQTLTSLGWFQYGYKQGTEMDFWFFYSREGNRDIVLYSSAMTFELAVYLKGSIDKPDFKREHITNMIKRNDNG